MSQSLLHIISSLDTGGAETMLLNLLAHSDRSRWTPSVVSLRDRGTLAGEIERLGVQVSAVGLGNGWPDVPASWRIRRQLKDAGSSILFGWMYHGNVAAWLLRASVRRRAPLLWNIQYTLDGTSHDKPLTQALIRIGARLSSSTSRIIYSSRLSAAQHAALGYDTTKATIIPNGFDTERFVPSPEARASWRARLGVGPDTVVIGRIGRYHAMKDYPGFLTAAAHVRREHADVHFVLAGRGLDSRNRALVRTIRHVGLGDSVSLLGEVRPVEALTAALDVACSSSAYGEAFPGVVAEAMSCGVPCVATDVGDSSWVLGNVGTTVPPRDPAALAQALRALAAAGPTQRANIGERARARIQSHFSIHEVVKQYEEVLTEAEVTARQR